MIVLREGHEWPHGPDVCVRLLGPDPCARIFDPEFQTGVETWNEGGGANGSTDQRRAHDIDTGSRAHDRTDSDAYRAAQGLGPAIPVTFGDGTEDEMCLGSFIAVDELP